MDEILNIKTIAFLLGLTHLMQVIVLVHQYRVNKTYPGVGWWLLWSAAEVIGFISMLFRTVPGIFNLIVIIQNAMFVAGTAFIYMGVRRFFDKPINFKIILPVYILFLAGIVQYLIVTPDVYVRSIIFNGSVAFFAGLTAYSLFTYKPKSIAGAANFCGVVFSIHGFVFLYLMILWIFGRPDPDIFKEDLFHAIPFIDALLIGLLCTFGLIIMLNSRLYADMLEAKKQMEQIFSTSPDAAVITRISDGMIVDVNEAYCLILGYSREELINRSTIDVNIWKNIKDRNMVVELIRVQGHCENYEAVFIRKDGSEVIGLMSAKILRMTGVPHMISISKDITTRKQAEAELRLKSQKLQELMAEKDKFFSILAHDLRSPFNGLLGLTQYLEEHQAKLSADEIGSTVTLLRKSTFKLYQLLENLLEWSRIQRGNLSFNPEPCHLESLINQALDIVRESAANKKLTLTSIIPSDIYIMADPQMINTIVRNLAFNAVKFTPEGGRINIKAVTNSDETIDVAVSDTGIGMSEVIISNFFKVNGYSNRLGTCGEPSSGLGLIICKEFIEKHGGHLRVESAEGKGSTFTFTLHHTIQPSI